MFDTIVQWITNLGFPIACVLALFFYINKQNDRKDQDAKSREDLYNKKVEEFQEQVMKFNETVASFNQTLKGIEDRISRIETRS